MLNRKKTLLLNIHCRDIIVVGLQEIVKLNAMSIFQGKNRTKIAEWE